MQRKLILGTALALMLGTATVTMTPANAAKGAGKAGKAGKNRGAKRERPMPALTADLLGKVLGTPLTDTQKTALTDANKAYVESVAKAVGLTADELKTKVIAYRKANPGGKRGAGKAGATTPTTAAP